MLFRVVILLCITQVSHSLIHYPLVEEFVKREYATAALLFGCNELYEKKLYRDFRENFSGFIQHFVVGSDRFTSDHRRFMSSKHYRFALILDLDCRSSLDFLNFCSLNSYFNGTFRWLLFGGEDFDVSVDFFKSQNLNIDSSVTVAVPSSEQELFQIFEVYGTMHRRCGKIHVTNVGQFSYNTTWENTTKNYSVRSDLEGITLFSVVATLGTTLDVTLEEHLSSLAPPRGYIAARFCYHIVQLLRRRLNFKYHPNNSTLLGIKPELHSSVHYIRARDYALEVIGTNSTRGIIGQLQQNLVDFSSTPMALTVERFNSFEQSVGIALVRIVTVFRHPKNSQMRLLFLKPFENLAWAAILVILLVAIFVLAAGYCTIRKHRRVDLFQLVISNVAMICQQGNPENISFGASRIAMMSVIVFSILIYQFYSCFLIGYFLVLPPKNIKTLQQLLESNLKVSVEDLSYNRDFFNKTLNPVAVKLFKTKVFPNKLGFVNATTGLDLVKRGGYAFHVDTSYGNRIILDTFTEQEICELQEVYLYPTRTLHINLPKGSPLKEIFRVSLRRLMEIGLQEYFSKKLLAKKPLCLQKNSGAVQVYLDEVVDLYWILLVGIGVSFGVFVVELICHRVLFYVEMKKFAKNYSGWID